MRADALVNRHLGLVMPLAGAIIAATWAVVIGSAHPGRAYSGALLIGLGLAVAGRLWGEWALDADRNLTLRGHVRSRLGFDGPPLDLATELDEQASDDWMARLGGPDERDLVAAVPGARWNGDTAHESFDWTPWVASPTAAPEPSAIAVTPASSELEVSAEPADPSWPTPPWRAEEPHVRLRLAN